MIMIAPFLLMILHFSQMGFTEDLTFISVIHSFLEKSPFTIITERLANCKHKFPEKQGFSALFSVFLTENENGTRERLRFLLFMFHPHSLLNPSEAETLIVSVTGISGKPECLPERLAGFFLIRLIGTITLH